MRRERAAARIRVPAVMRRSLIVISQVSVPPLSSVGRGSIAVRLVAQALFVVQAILHSVFLPRATAA